MTSAGKTPGLAWSCRQPRRGCLPAGDLERAFVLRFVGLGGWEQSSSSRGQQEHQARILRTLGRVNRRKTAEYYPCRIRVPSVALTSRKRSAGLDAMKA